MTPRYGNELVVRVHEQLGPRALDRHRFDGASVRRELSALDDAAPLEQLERVAIRDLVERNRQIELVGAHAERRARHRDALGVAGELEFRLGGLQRSELDVAVGKNEHAPAFDAPVHAAGHLQNLVRAEVLLREHVAAAIDDVEELLVVDDHRVEAAHVERALAGRGHRQEVRLLLAALEKRTDDANRLAAVVERRVDARRHTVARVRPLPPRRGASARTARRRAAASPVAGEMLHQETVMPVCE